MKKTLSLILVALVFVACGGNAQNEETIENATEETNAEAVEVADGYYGEEINEDGAVTMSEFIAKMEQGDSLAIKVNGTIEKTCKMKGCWMTVVTNEGETMRVSFKDYGFFVPKEGMEGKEVIIEGMAKKKLLTVEELKHYAEDGGATKEELEAITEDSEELTFVANGVIIKEVETGSEPN